MEDPNHPAHHYGVVMCCAPGTKGLIDLLSGQANAGVNHAALSIYSHCDLLEKS